MLKLIGKYLKQPSTLRGLIGLVAALGVSLSPEQVEAIIVAAGSAMALVEVFRNEGKSDE